MRKKASNWFVVHRCISGNVQNMLKNVPQIITSQVERLLTSNVVTRYSFSDGFGFSLVGLCFIFYSAMLDLKYLKKWRSVVTYFMGLISPESFLGGLPLILLLEHGEFIGDILFTDTYGITPHVCILNLKQPRNQLNNWLSGRLSTSEKWKRNPATLDIFH